MSLLSLLAFAGALAAQPPPYQTTLIPKRSYTEDRDVGGKNVRYYRVPFTIERLDGARPPKYIPTADVPSEGEEIVVKEDDVRIDDVEILRPQVKPPTIVLALDISGSMERPAPSGKTKMREAQDAALAFLGNLSERADVGLVLFDHQVRPPVPPVGPGATPAQLKDNRAKVRDQIAKAKPQGGTAYLDATMAALDLVEKIPGPRVVILMTDGVDMSSKVRLADVIKRARAAKVAVYTLGVGDRGKNDPVNTVLVLDRSGSMASPASSEERFTKMEALHEAACAFVNLTRANSALALLPFSNTLDVPTALVGMDGGITDADKRQLKADIKGLAPFGGTCLYDATYEAIETLAAANRPGKRVVIVLTDGVDEEPGSRQRIENVIERANEARVQIYTLGFGREAEVNTAVLRRLAEEPKLRGRFDMATSRRQLIDLFEALSINIHDDGIDEPALEQLANGTGGEYHHVRDAAELHKTYTKVVEDVNLTYYAIFASRQQVADGTQRKVVITIQRHGQTVSTETSVGDQRGGLVVVPEVNHWVFAVFFALLLGALVAPALLRRTSQPADSP